MNSDLLPHCEVCLTRRFGWTMQASEAPAMEGEGWPELKDALDDKAESWVDCDVTSVASSWLDIGGAEEQDDDDDEAGIVLVSASGVHAAVPQAAGPPSWSAIVGKSGRGKALPATGVAVAPPLWRKPAVRASTKAFEEEEVDTTLDELDARRMKGTQRRRVKNR